ncbi:MAG: 3-hydroxyacyl-ACP dehydratase [Bacteroidetes bacterium]|nr:3-hydroxyacyl-ACP dehydratase [Bacteroidota bacterium]
MLAQGEEILKYIPQRPPFVFIDRLIEANGTKIVSGYKIISDNPLVEENMLSESGLIENIAQTAAAGVGYNCISNNKPVIPGFIGAVKKLTVVERPAVNGEIITTVDIVSEVMNATIIHGSVLYNGKVIAECDMNIFLQQQ